MNTRQQPDWQLPLAEVQALINESMADRAGYIDATRLATALMGDSIARSIGVVSHRLPAAVVASKLKRNPSASRTSLQCPAQ